MENARSFLAALAVVAIESSAIAVDMSFSTHPSFQDPPGQNLVVTANMGDVLQVYLLAGTSGTTGFVNHLNFNVRAEATGGASILTYPGILSMLNGYNGGNPFDPNSFTWNYMGVFGGYNVNGHLIDNAEAYSSSYRPYISVESPPTAIGYMTIRPTHTGTLRLFLQVGPNGMTETSGVTTHRFGFGDAPVPNVPGAESAVPDLTIIIPEPSLAMVAGFALVGRRRR